MTYVTHITFFSYIFRRSAVEIFCNSMLTPVMGSAEANNSTV